MLKYYISKIQNLLFKFEKISSYQLSHFLGVYSWKILTKCFRICHSFGIRKIKDIYQGIHCNKSDVDDAWNDKIKTVLWFSYSKNVLSFLTFKLPSLLILASFLGWVKKWTLAKAKVKMKDDSKSFMGSKHWLNVKCENQLTFNSL